MAWQSVLIGFLVLGVVSLWGENRIQQERFEAFVASSSAVDGAAQCTAKLQDKDDTYVPEKDDWSFSGFRYGIGERSVWPFNYVGWGRDWRLANGAIYMRFDFKNGGLSCDYGPGRPGSAYINQ